MGIQARGCKFHSDHHTGRSAAEDEPRYASCNNNNNNNNNPLKKHNFVT